MRQFKIKENITNKDKNLDRYLLEIGKHERITPTEEVELTQRIKAGDEKALEKLVNANLRFVVSVAKQYQNQGFTLPDLIDEGNIGLIKAAQRFDETRGFKFISYAVWWIRQSILLAIAEESKIIRLPTNQQLYLNKINKTRELLEQNLQRAPLHEEITEALEMDWKKMQAVVTASKQALSLDVPISLHDQDTSLLSDTIASTIFPQPDFLIETEYFKNEIANLLTTLSEKEEFVLTHYFGIGKADREHTFEEIAILLGIPKNVVKQTKEKAIRRLKRQTTTQKKYESLNFSQ